LKAYSPLFRENWLAEKPKFIHERRLNSPPYNFAEKL
jgi:hypothetical protein